MCIPWREARLSVRPGITGLWQICRHERSQRRLPPVDLLRPALRPAHVAVARPQDPRATVITLGGKGPRTAVLDDLAQQVPRARMTACASPLPARLLSGAASGSPPSSTGCARWPSPELPRMYEPAAEALPVPPAAHARTGVVARGAEPPLHRDHARSAWPAERPEAARRVAAGRPLARRAVAQACSHELPARSSNLGDVALDALGRRTPWASPTGDAGLGAAGRAAPRRGAALHGRAGLGAGRAARWTPTRPHARPARPRGPPAAATRSTRVGALPARDRRRRAACASHVACFADLVYPIQALSLLRARTGDRARARRGRALRASASAACRARRASGGGTTTCAPGDVIERYPVYAVHQDAMAPMALFALRGRRRARLREHVRRGLEWLRSAPRARAAARWSTTEAGLIWRKVARREPGKLARTLQALASRARTRRCACPALDAAAARRARSTTRTAPTTWAGCSTPARGKRRARVARRRPARCRAGAPAPVRELLGVPVAPLTMDEVLDRVEDADRERARRCRSASSTRPRS